MLNEIASWLVDPVGLTPHGFCLLWEPGLIWTYAVSDAGIAFAYFTIPLALAVVARRRQDLVFRPMVWLFAGFILLCGTTHLLDVLTLWVSAYRLEGLVKAATAVVSIVTAMALWRLLPHVLALPSSAQLERANVALRESEGRYRTSFEYSPVPMHTLNESGIITGVSRSWLTLMGYTEREAVGRHITDFRPTGGDRWVKDDLNALTVKGEVHDLERRYLHADGSVLDVLLSARLEHRDEATWIICVLIDVTGRRQTEKALHASEERLHQAQKMEAVGQLTGGIAHDFNNMLQSIIGSLELMERRVAQGRTNECARYVAAARKAADNANALTNRMLAFARRQALQPTIIDPAMLLRGMTDLIHSGIGPLVRLELDLQNGWSTACDFNQLESAILNLAINAREAMPEGGLLRISTADRTLIKAELDDQEDIKPGNYVEIAVTDTGTGMDPDVLRRAFEPFFTTRPFGQGTGLGLSQVYGFVRQSGGFVRLESEVRHGTTVRLYLSRKDRTVGGSSESAAAAKPVGPAGGVLSGMPPKAMVLVVEDEERIREMIVSLLNEQGYAVMEAEDGPSGLRIVQSPIQIDLLLTDVGLPGLNGRQLADAARATRPNLPVLFITGYAGTALDNQKLELGMEILHKPFAFDILATRVRDMINSAFTTQ